MVKKPAPAKRQSTARREPPRPRIRLFKAMSWYDRSHDPIGFFAQVHREMGRLGVSEHELTVFHQSVLRDTGDWLSENPGEAFARLTDWRRLDLDVLSKRSEDSRNTKPQIELSAEITKKRNLTVRWYPRGWHEAIIDYSNRDGNPFNLIDRRRFPQPPDFKWFEGDESATFQSRASNELMFIRGVGDLSPAPQQEYGYYATYNTDVVSSLLIAMVAAAYNALIARLSLSFSVTVLDRFAIETRDEVDTTDEFTAWHPTHRPVIWEIIYTKPPSLWSSAEVVEFKAKT